MIKTENVVDKNYGLLIYIGLFFLTWTGYEVGLAPLLGQVFSGYLLAVVRFLIKSAVWILPVVAYLRYTEESSVFHSLRLVGNLKQGLVGALYVSALFFIYNYIRLMVLGNVVFEVSLSLDTWLNRIILAGLAEEIVFRGFLLRALMNRVQFRTAAIVSSVLFVLIHYPIWSMRGAITLPDSLYVFVFGLIMAYTYKKTGSLWSCILAHSLHNLIMTVLVFS